MLLVNTSNEDGNRAFCDARIPNIDNNFEESILPFNNFATNKSCYILRRHSRVFRSSKPQRSRYGGKLFGSRQCRLRKASRSVFLLFVGSNETTAKSILGTPSRGENELRNNTTLVDNDEPLSRLS